MIWRDVISKSSAFLDAKGVPEAPVASELLVARLLKVGRGLLSTHLEKEANEAHLEAMRRALARLVKGEPIQYVLGEWDFRTLTLKCDARALIPRPETEELVTRVLNHLQTSQLPNSPTSQPPNPPTSQPPNFPTPQPPNPPTSQLPNPPTSQPLVLDIGTGTGAIILSLAKEYRGDAIFLGTDISAEAIELAKENAERCGLSKRVKFAVADGLDDFDEPQSVDIIVSNPPYIATSVCETLDPRVKDFEPRLALDGGVEGLDFYDRYLADALNLLKPGGAVFFEIGADQGAALRKLMTDYGFSEIRIEKDYAGQDRYASGVLA